MSNIYIQEPPTFGKVLLKTTVGDIDIELWAKETPKACRNFIQLCMEGYYNGTMFHRIVKGFIVQGGDPTGSGEGGESIYGQTFKDEFHSRLRFCRRGLVAMANAGKDDNGSQFFFTLAETPELQNKHTIFGKVTGDTVFNMLKLENGLVDQNERPQYPQKIMKTVVLNNPFPDIIPRSLPNSELKDPQKEGKRKREKKSGVKDFKLLSFGEEAEEDEEETEIANKRFSGRSKSTHDLLDDPKLSAVPAIEKADDGDSSSLSGDEKSAESDTGAQEEVEESGEVDRIRLKLLARKTPKKPEIATNQDDDDFETYTLGQDAREERQKKTDDIKRQIRELRKEMRPQTDRKKDPITEELPKSTESSILQDYKKDLVEFEKKKEKLPTKGVDREAFTMSLLAKFQKKLENVKEKAEDEIEKEPEEGDEGDLGQDDGKWMSHKLQFEATAPNDAKDANLKDQKGDDWFKIDDPRNPLNQRRRQASKLLANTKR